MCKKAVFIWLMVSIASTGISMAQNRISNNVLINSLLRVGQQSTGTAAVSGADTLLGQNLYNPFNKTTIIPYTLPGHFSKAQICMIDEHGKTIKQVYVGGSGRLTLTLRFWETQGATGYMLQINGKTVAVRPLVFDTETTASLKQ